MARSGLQIAGAIADANRECLFWRISEGQVVEIPLRTQISPRKKCQIGRMHELRFSPSDGLDGSARLVFGALMSAA